MKKKCVPLLLAIMLAFTNGSVYAASTQSTSSSSTTTQEDDDVLTVDEALSKAIAYSSTLKSLYEQKEINELSADDTRTSLVNSSEYIDLTNLNVELKNLMYNIQNYGTNVEIEKEKIRLNIIELFASIINAEDAIDLYEEEIELNERELKIAEVKNSLGLLSQTEYNGLVTENETVKSTKQSLESALDEAYASLNQILGQDIDTKYTVELNIEYEPLGDVDLDYAIAKATTNSQSIKDLEEAAEIAGYKVDVYSVEYSGGYEESVRNSYAQATRELADAKTSMEVNLKSLYNNIVSAETTYNNNLASLAQQKQELEVKKVQLELGKITQLEYDQAEYQINQLENTIKQSVYSHYVDVCRFNNPDLM